MFMRASEPPQAKNSWHIPFFKGKSFVINTVLLLLSAGTTVWFVSDYFYQQTLNDLTSRELQLNVEQQALTKQKVLTGSVSAFRDKARLYAHSQSLIDQLQDSHDSKSPGILSLDKAPWLQGDSILENQIPVEYALLVNAENRVLTIYSLDAKAVPAELINAGAGKFKAGNDGKTIDRIGSEEYLFVSSDITDTNKVLGKLVLVTKFTNSLLYQLIGNHTSSFIHAIVDINNGQVIRGNPLVPNPVLPGITTSHPDLKLVHQAPVLSTPDGQNLAFMVWFNEAEVSGLAQAIKVIDRKQRIATLLIFSLLLMGIIWRTNSRLQRVHKHISKYSNKFGIQENNDTENDVIDCINKNITSFTNEMIAEASAFEYQAMHDALTSLPNRSFMLERLNMEISKCEQSKSCMALLIIDLDRFKEINDTLGHQMGDRVLQEVGRRLTALLRQTDMVSRLGGDEFAIILPGASRSQVIGVCRKLFRVMERPIKIDSMPLRIGMSIGAAICPEHGHSASQLMQRADIAMYNAKRHQSGFAIYNKDKDNNNTSRLGLSSALHEAIERDELLLEYQPLVDMKSGNVACVEALVRWQHPSMGLVQPDDFISLAEQNGVIRPLTLWVIDHALAQIVQWRSTGIDLRLSINLSVCSLQDRGLPSQVEKLINKHKVKPDTIMLEITESAIMSDLSSARRVMRRLSNMGFQLSIDDFGTGYSSLSYLKQLPVDEVKIDKSFVLDMNESESDAVIVQSTINLAHDLGMKVVAEGVENRQIWEKIQSLGCDTAQGYFISKPAAASDLVRWMELRGTKEFEPELNSEAVAD
jgi:diguanylate cyclase (GGDEF)-like protein